MYKKLSGVKTPTYILRVYIQKNNTTSGVLFLDGTPKRIRIAVYTVKGCCPRPLDDGGLFRQVQFYDKQTLMSTTCE